MAQTTKTNVVRLSGRDQFTNLPVKSPAGAADRILLEDVADGGRKKAVLVSALTAGIPPIPHAASHAPGAADALVHAPTHDLYVDKYRVDAYTEDGSQERPYKTLQAAINRVAAVAVAGQDWSLLTKTGQYAENLVLESLGLHSLAIVGVGGVVGIVPAAGNAFQSTANNANLLKLRLINVEMTKPIVVTGPAGGACFADVWCQDVKLAAGATLTLTCIKNWSMMSSYVEDAVALNNVQWFYCDSARMNGALAMTCDSTQPAPAGGADGTTFLNGVYQMGNVTLAKVGTAAGVVVVMGGSRINGSSGTITVPVGWTFQNYSSFVRGNLTNAGTYQQRGGFVEKTFLNTGTWNNDTDSGPSPRVLYVDVARTDTYLESGTRGRPYKLIQSAINRVIANGDNTQSLPYLIDINPGIYPENLILEDPKLVSLIFKGQGSRLQVQINPASGYALRSIANNANLTDLHMENIQFIKPTQMIGATNGTFFGFNHMFENCYWPSTAAAVFRNMVYPSFTGMWSKFSGGVTFSNCTQVSLAFIGGFKSSGFVIETDESANMPNSFGTGTAVIVSGGTCPDVTWSLLNIVTKTGTALQVRCCRLGSAGGTIPLNATIIAYFSTLVGNYVATGTLTLYASFASGTITGAGAITYYQSNDQVRNTSSVPGTTTKDALNKLWASGQREIFFACDTDGNQGTYRVQTVAGSGNWRFNFRVPSDFVSLVSAKVIGMPVANIAAVSIWLDSNYGAPGETIAEHSESDHGQAFSGTAGEWTEFDASSVFGDLAAGDLAGLLVEHKAIGTSVKYLGLVLTYDIA